MCRTIKKLRFPDRSPADEELQGAALQYVRKVTGYRKPSKANEEAFDATIVEITAATRRLFDDLIIR
ncbi:MAG: DUF2277 domain-containing protein [Candidatus Promineifilaceae bacterium]